jgi:hypothetical protein
MEKEVTVDLTFRGLGPWGPGKGTNLQASEVDANFWSIATEILNLQNNPALPNGIASITVSGTQMTITLANGDVMGPFTIPLLTFRWRDEWQPNAPYAELDVFKVTNLGIYLVEFPHTSGDSFDPDIQVGGAPALTQLFGSADASLGSLPDVFLTPLQNGDALIWVDADQKWENFQLGDMAYQDSTFVQITGGSITGMSTPLSPADVATKAYVDGAITGGSLIPSPTLMSNIQGFAAPAAPNNLSNVLDAALGSTITGNLIFRSGAGWQVLPPGPAGDILQSNGPGVGLAWVTSPGAGVVSISPGTGISTGAGPITSSGTVALAVIADNNLVANISGATAAPVPVTLSQFLDHAVSTSRGALLTRTSTGWVALTPGAAGLYLKTQGSGSDLVWDAPAGAGTVLSVASGTGLTGGPITAAGTLSFAPIADGNVLANTSGASAAPVPTTVSVLLDKALGTTQGFVAYRSGTTWVALAPGTNGQILTTGGAAANPSWQNAPITGSSIGNNLIVSNISGAAGVPTANTLSAILDAILSSARGSLVFRTNSGWMALAPGAAGQVLQTGGASGDPSWAANAGGLLAISSPQPEDVLVYSSSSGKFENRRPKYNIGAYVAGSMTPAQNLLFHKFSRAVTLPSNLGPYLGHATEAGSAAAATASTAITLSRALAATPTTFSTVATIIFAAGALVGSLSAQGALTFAQGDILRVRGPAIADATLADFHLTLVGYET